MTSLSHKNLALLEFDLRYFNQCRFLVGVDEAGRGPFAGPVSASAVLLDKSFYERVKSSSKKFPVNDSKKLIKKEREQCYAMMQSWEREGHLKFANVMLGVSHIEQYNILGATSMAMGMALEAVEQASGLRFAKKDTTDDSRDVCVIIDGRPVKRLTYEHEGVVKGDAKSMVIAMASIIAKVRRDAVMLELHEKYPQYGFDSHKGYGTKSHCEAILKHGPCPEHRPAFLRKLYGERR